MTKQAFITFDSDKNELDCYDDWNIANLATLKKEIEAIPSPKSGSITINGKHVAKMDSAGAFILTKCIKKLSDKKIKTHLVNFSDQHKKIMEFSEEKQKAPKQHIPKVKELSWLQKLGKFALDQAEEFYQYINFIGELFFESLRVLHTPKLWRWNTIASITNQAGTSALPIIALLSFMIGVVISFQMGNQLKNFGANVFIVNLIGFSVLREFGPLLTAIMIAGRTGSAFAAELGLMKINAEVDALNTMGVTPTELLILPRLISLFIILPLLTIWADIFGVLGGMLMANNILGISWHEFILRFQHEIPLRALLIGIGKAPVFALIIASIGCFQGMSVHGSAKSVGIRTTRSVVLAIFFIIVVDAIFSVLLNQFNL
jgi:phospholipid/cholesterol/gamma-HCH transport system permease protein